MVVTIDGNRITDRESFHTVFAESFGFPYFYGRNMDAWIDCMSSLDEPAAGLTTIHASHGETVTISLVGVDAMASRCPDVYSGLVDCIAFVNERYRASGCAVFIALASRPC